MRLPTLLLAFACSAMTLLVSFATAEAKDPNPPQVDRFRAFLIYEDTGDLSKNKAKEENQIIANDEKGTSIQMLMDVVLTGPANEAYDNPPFLYIVVYPMGAQPGDRPMIDTGYPISFMGSTGEAVRTLVVDHNCNGYDIEAFVMVGDKRVSELKKSFSITCGD